MQINEEIEEEKMLNDTELLEEYNKLRKKYEFVCKKNKELEEAKKQKEEEIRKGFGRKKGEKMRNKISEEKIYNDLRNRSNVLLENLKLSVKEWGLLNKTNFTLYNLGKIDGSLQTLKKVEEFIIWDYLGVIEKGFIYKDKFEKLKQKLLVNPKGCGKESCKNPDVLICGDLDLDGRPMLCDKCKRLVK